ncbi:FERM domain-containing protein 3 [Larimichthys crocea]|uniref:FERM domain-containing protein 3 n=1 Tax=Larimichthys crocea TaxID=215358 RepID=A0A6G0IKP9_LARCR|nr:FERM domain-containing protein 3 [Larimichthys crocea]
MEVLEHRNSGDVGGLMQSSLESNVGNTMSCGSQGRAGGLGLDMNPERLEGERIEEGQAGPLEVFHPGVSTDERASSIVVAEALRHPKLNDEVEEDDEASGPLTISELVYSPCASMLPTPVDDSQGGVDLLFSSPVQSPARLLRELHADPDIQAQLEAERERDRAYERTRMAARSRVGGVLSSSLRLLSSNERVNACLLSVARLVAVVMGVLLVTVPTLLLLLESDIDVSFLHEIRQTPEFEQFHYEYYCPLRRWILCRISMAMENLWSD